MWGHLWGNLGFW